jgi:phosphatidylinositol alpha 1,6-mannosyltransferase
LEHQIRAASAVIAISDFVAQEVARLGINPGRLRRIYNGFAPQRFGGLAGKRDPEREHRGVPVGAWVVGVVARYAPNKRHAFLFEAIAKAAGEVPQIHVLLLGDPASEPEGYRRATIEARGMGVEHRVTEVHICEDMGAFYSACDVVVLCSVREPFGNCVCEAMAAGRPVVVAGSGGYLEIVEHGRTGIVADARDSQTVADALIQLAKSRAMCDALTTAAREAIDQPAWSTERYVGEVVGVYEQVLAERAG